MNENYLSSQSQMNSYMQGPIQDNSPGPQTKPTTTSDLLRLRLHLNFTDPNSKTLHDSFENLNTNKSSTLYAPIMKSHRDKSDTLNVAPAVGTIQLLSAKRLLRSICILR